MTHHRRRNNGTDPSKINETVELSPAQRYAAFKQTQAKQRTVAAEFARSMPFELDEFQMQANDALEAGDNVLVAAPTGAGKTVVADFAIYLAQTRNVKAFYTTPIKALSNQKYHDLVDQYGTDKVGLLTGDTSINSEADIVVMTTEVLRNMLYEHSVTLEALRYVILDEVHYLADRFRGPVWEEVIIHLPKNVNIIGLSATVSNVEDFSEWIESVRGKTTLVMSEQRPVPLEQHVLVQADDHTEPELIDLYRRDANGEQTVKLNAQLINRLDQLDRQAERRKGERRPDKRRAKGKGGRWDDRPHKVERHTPRRWAVVDELNFLDMLPGIYFIFSRNGCDQAVDQCINAGLELTTSDEVQQIRRIVDEIVERLFEEGLVKMVFATETLALGINMPARCVVVEKLEKFDGTGHVGLTPGEFTQLTGRAGRRGIDTIGHAVVVDHHGFVPATAAALSSKRVYPLHSSFRPTFNMAVNLLNSSDYETARVTLDHSFAQWEANESAWQLEAQMETLCKALEGYEQAFQCEFGDFKKFMRLRMRLSDLEKNERRKLKHEVFRTQKERSQAFMDLDKRIKKLREEDRDHPCRKCPDVQKHLKWGHRWAREMRELERVQHRYDSRTGSVARQFDHICAVLSNLGYLQPVRESAGHGDYQLTERGQLLRHLYSELDLVLAQAIDDGAFDGLNACELASVVASLVFEARRGGGGEPRRYPGGIQGNVAVCAAQLKGVHASIAMLCEDHMLEEPRQLDFGITDIVYDWAQGESLSQVLYGTDLTGGDFVRNGKRLADVLQQIAVAGPYLADRAETLAPVAKQAYDRINRGIVAYSGVD